MDIGIDLGTTFSVIAVKGKVELAPGYDGAEYLEEIDVTILPSTTGNLTIPSVMWWHPAPSADEEDSYVLDGDVKGERLLPKMTGVELGVDDRITGRRYGVT